MRSRFRFLISAPSIGFPPESRISFLAAGAAPSRPDAVAPLAANLHRTPIEIRIAKEPSALGGRANASLFITVPGAPEDSQQLARLLAADLSEHISFFYPGFKILTGGLTAERLADTPEENAEIANGPYWAQLSLREATPPSPFDPELLCLFPYARDLLTPISQLNAAERSTNPVDAYLSAFKVLECLYHRSGRSFVHSFNVSVELREAVRSELPVSVEEGVLRPMSEHEIDRFLEDLAATRNRCAHLRDKGIYGYSQRAPEISTVVTPLLEKLVEVARHILHSRMLFARRARKADNSPESAP